MTFLRRSEWTLLAFILIYSFVPVVGGLIRVFELAGGPTIAPSNPRASANPVPITLHILASLVFCVAGAAQFVPSIRHRYPAPHRVNGRIVAVAGCVSAASGLWMTQAYTFPADLQGSLLYWVRMVLGSSMIGLIVWAVITIRVRDVFRHAASMLRAYAIAQGASTQAVLGIGWIVFVGSEAMGPLRDGLMTFAWGLNLLVAEILIKNLPRTGTRQVRQTTAQPPQLTFQTSRKQV